MPLSTQVQAVLFDIDGTLIDSTAAVERAWRTWAGRHGLDAAAILAGSHGRRSRDVVAELLPASEVDAAVAELVGLAHADLAGIVALPAAAEVLAALPGKRIACVTSGERSIMTARLRAAGLPVPATMVCAEDVAAGKPDPQGYLLAAAQLGADPRRCLVIEDAPAGIAAGRAAGSQVLAVATSHAAADLRQAHCVVADLTGVRLRAAAHGISLDVG